MKKPRTFAYIGAAFVIGFLAARWTDSMAVHTPPGAERPDAAFALHQMELFVAHLQDTGQTNTLQQFYVYVNAAETGHRLMDVGDTLAVLRNFRDGHTNEAMGMLEDRLSSDIVGAVLYYRKLPAAIRETASLKNVEDARDYRAKYPSAHHDANIDKAVEDVFKYLDGKGPT